MNMNKLIVSNSKFKRIKLLTSAFKNCAIFTNTIFETPPEITKTKFESRNVNFGNVSFRDEKSEEALGSFRQLKYICEEAGYEAGAILFHAYELETYYNLYLRKDFSLVLWPEKIFSYFYKALTDYGRNLVMPFLWLAIAFILGSTWNFIFTHNISSDIFCTLTNSGLLSLKNTLGPLMYALPKDIREMNPNGFLAYIFWLQN